MKLTSIQLKIPRNKKKLILAIIFLRLLIWWEHFFINEKESITNGGPVEIWYIFYKEEKDTKNTLQNLSKFHTEVKKLPPLTMDPILQPQAMVMEHMHSLTSPIH